MPDLLIRNLAEADIQQLERCARALGISRSEYVRRRLRQERSPEGITVAALQSFAAVHADLADPSVMARAWR
ncbi:MAG: hypothetical protein M3Z27_02840 [Actinomycetota bacterium]|nr:hypothetical protein [Actinomycetota bacterium]